MVWFCTPIKPLFVIFADHITIKDMKHKTAAILTILFVVVLLGVVYVGKDSLDDTPTLTDTPISAENEDLMVYDEDIIKINKNTFSVLIADTPTKRALGLSGREELAMKHGMLFIFEKSGDYPFWMKDMNFAIDILWINEHNEIIHILERVAPETYPTAFTSSEDALYVLELPAGTIVETDINLGDKIIYGQ